QPTTAAAASAPKAPPPKIVGPGANILVPGLVPPPPEPALHERPHGAPQSWRDHPGASHDRLRPAGPEAHGHAPQSHTPQSHTPHDVQPRRDQPRPPRPAHSQSRPAVAREPKPKREMPPAPVLTDDLRQTIQARYLELAQPVEFDGIRSRIAAELDVPKALVKKAVLELRSEMKLPSWWELQSYHGTESDLDRIRAVYMPLLPIPPVGIHKQIAADLELDAGAVYQAIRRIRAEMRLPQYNPPEAHAGETAAQGPEATVEAAPASVGNGGATTPSALP
ncbi:MAG TPA: hypothetical protein VFU88_03370, partial [Ktedonobacterales bacterium]|nr:hypothetical protein [Ktedonobacterales bacterium]